MAGISDLKYENIRDVRACFYQGGIWTKNALSEKTGLSLAGTTNILKYLLEEEEIILSGKAVSKVGRKSKQYIMNPDKFHIGCVIAAYGKWSHSLWTASYKLNGECIFREQADDTTLDADFVLNMTQKMVEKDPLIRCITVSVPGVVSGGVINTCDIDALENTALEEMMRERFAMPVALENDVNTAAAGFAAKHRNHQNLVLIYQPEVSLVGSGIMINRKLYQGSSGAAGEIKHMAVKDNDDARSILIAQMQNLCAVLNPSLIGWYSDVIREGTIKAKDINVPEQLKCDVVRVTDFYLLLARGLFAKGMDSLVGHESIRKGK